MDFADNCCKCSVKFKVNDEIIKCEGSCENKYHPKGVKLNASGIQR